MLEVTIVIASDSSGGSPSSTRWVEGSALHRAVTAYDRESNGVELQILVYPHGEGGESAWSRGTRNASCAFIHFTSDAFEPHPGWLQAATSACRAGVIPMPALWGADGYCFSSGHDWKPCASSMLPFLSRAQLEKTGPPHTGHAWPGLPCALRTEYAFTWHEEGGAVRTAGAPTPPQQ